MNSYLARRPIVLALFKLLFVALAQLPVAAAVPLRLASVLFAEDPDPKSPEGPNLWLYLGVAAALVLLGGAFAGLTIALMGQDEIYLQVIKTSGEGAEKNHAAKVLRLLKRGKHWVLVTLLLSNVITNETLPIVLDRSLGGGWPAVLGSTVLIVIFGEIVPQSICVRYGLPIGSWMAPFVLGLMYIMAPIAWPTAKLLDYLLGEDHGQIYKKAGLKTLVTLHKTLGVAGEQLNSDEVTIISACLDLKEKTVETIMTPMEDVFTMSMDTILDEKTMDLILSQGFSRIPIYSPENPENFVGMLLVKMLITYDPEDCKAVSHFALATLPETWPITSCLDIINFFQEGKSHMVLVTEFPGDDHGALGVVTLEDVIEELIGEEIIDESDVFVDVGRAIRRMAPAPKQRVPKGKVVIEEDETTEAQAMAQEGILVDIGENEAVPAEVLQRSRTPATEALQRTRTNDPTISPRIPHAFMYRRRSSTADSDKGEVQRRALNSDIRDHLKHLGPANAASRPLSTRQKTITMKAPRRSASHDRPNGASTPSRRVSEPLNYQNDQAGTPTNVDPIIGSAGGGAKDGIQALQSAYGTINRSPPRTANAESKSISTPVKDKAVPAGQEEDLPNIHISPDHSPSRGHSNVWHLDHSKTTPVDNKEFQRQSRSSDRERASSIRSTSSRSTLRSLPDRIRERSGSPQLGRGPARSGSITEHVVDVGGIKKVVLETTSSSSSDETAGRGSGQGVDGHIGSRSGLTASRRPGEENDSHASGATLTPSDVGSGGKKKRRRKKGRSGKSTDVNESQHLLGGHR